MRLTKCNKCPRTTISESDFTYLLVVFPTKKRRMPTTWDDEEKLADEADLVNAELVDKEDVKPNELELHLCPRHTLWFQQIFNSEIRKHRRKSRLTR